MPAPSTTSSRRCSSPGFYYKTFMWPKGFWERVYEPRIRAAAGFGKAPAKPRSRPLPQPLRPLRRPRHRLRPRRPRGGRRGVARRVRGSSSATSRPSSAAPSCRDHGDDRGPAGAGLGDRHRHVARPQGQGAPPAPHDGVRLVLAKFRRASPSGSPTISPTPTRTCRASGCGRCAPSEVVIAAGAIERPLVFPENDRPGIMLAEAGTDLCQSLRRSAGQDGGRLHRLRFRLSRRARPQGSRRNIAADRRPAAAKAALSRRRRAPPASESKVGATICGTAGRHRVSSVRLGWIKADGTRRARRGGRLRPRADVRRLDAVRAHVLPVARQGRASTRRSESFVPGALARRRAIGGRLPGHLRVSAMSSMTAFAPGTKRRGRRGPTGGALKTFEVDGADPQDGPAYGRLRARPQQRPGQGLCRFPARRHGQGHRCSRRARASARSSM